MKPLKDMITAALALSKQTLERFLSNSDNILQMEEMAKLIANAYQRGAKVIIFGNGGSMCDAMHFAEELTGRFHLDRPALPAIAISDPAHLTCVANDYGFDQVFSRGVEAYAKPGDVVIGISTSGNSQNVIKALAKAQELKCFTIALLGNSGGLLNGTCDYQLIVAAQTTDRIQEVHTAILHILIQCIEAQLFFAEDSASQTTTDPNPPYGDNQ
ncbi:MAG: D-sedoheptulose 7-phosphate isomerase [Candidatus Cloacimonadaceae bacterium]|nr:D-sedoheptulose 7-phosphate isomerase [Candidatus Cloacimonadaceae bacterium]